MSIRCSECRVEFTLDARDRDFLSRFSVPEPDACPPCRERRRTLHVNHLHLFRGECAATGTSLVTCYPPNTPFTIYSQAHWHSDAVDNRAFGRPFDFSRPFFEQFAELQLDVPRPALFTDYVRDENSEYTNYAGRNKSCYLLFDSDENRECLYGYSMNSCRSSLDCYRADGSELGYELVDCQECYHSAFLSNCSKCTDSYFLANCVGCKRCAFSSNLRHKEYYIRNKKVSPAEFDDFVTRMSSFSNLDACRTEFDGYRRTFPQRALRGIHNEDVVGNYLTHSKNAYWCFDSREVWDVRYCSQAFMPVKDSMDVNESGEGELLYECTTVGYGAYNIRFSLMCLSQVQDLTYCALCFRGCKDLFGCIGLKREKFCVLNQQYTEAEYRALVPRIQAHMEQTGEWGRFFPAALSTVPYNLSVAQQISPLSREEAEFIGYPWYEEELPAHPNRAEADAVPDASADLPVDRGMLSSCSECGKVFKLLPQELQFYREFPLPAPRRCFLCRHKVRHEGRTPRFLWKQPCAKCGASLEAAYPPGSGEIVTCESCFLESLDEERP